MNTSQLEERIRQAGLKVTPQRINVLNILMESNHPSAEEIMGIIKKKYSSISTGTIYHILDVFVEHGILRKVPNEGESMRYDAILDNHHHLIDIDTGAIHDLFDEGVLEILTDYFDTHPIRGFEISDVKLNLIGKFTTNNT